MTEIVDKLRAKRLWLHAQRLDSAEPFGRGPRATRRAIEHLGYVQIDTINVIERCHHHILFTRIPSYRRRHLAKAQSEDRSVFEYWTHALAYIPTRDYRFFMADMVRRRKTASYWSVRVDPRDVRRMGARILANGPLSIRDIDDDVLVEKQHAWDTRKPSKRALLLGFHWGLFAVSRRTGMLKTYELAARHFDWRVRPKAATEREVAGYLLDSALDAQGIVSVDSACHGRARKKPALRRLIEKEVRGGRLLSVRIEGAEKLEHWVRPRDLELASSYQPELTRLLSPFDPLVIQRKRSSLILGYSHLFEAYVPKKDRKLGYFALPVLVDDRIVAAIDLKTDRTAKRLLVQKWTWLGREKSASRKRRIEEELDRFEKFQLDD
jgi:uncharacterized protein YcaQ